MAKDMNSLSKAMKEAKGQSKAPDSPKPPDKPRPSAATPSRPGGPPGHRDGQRGSPAAPRSAATPNPVSREQGKMPEMRFFDTDGNVAKDLYLGQAEAWAEHIAKDKWGKMQLTSHQLRRFYGDVKNTERKVLFEPGQFGRFWPLVGMLRAKAAYASNPKNQKIPREFKEFIDTAIDKIDADEKAFLAFCKFFEAVVGYFTERE